MMGKGLRALKLGAVLMALLGLARAAGGIVLLARGAAADPDIHATDSTVTAVGAVLLALGLILLGAAAGVFLRRRLYWRIGIACTVAFVVDGAINGALLYGKPGDQGTVVNLLVAAIIVAYLLRGASALEVGRAAG